MKPMIACKESERGKLDFYVFVDRKRYYLFSQGYKCGVKKYFENGVTLDDGIKTHRSDYGIQKTVEKIPAYIRYVEKENQISIYEKKARRISKSERNVDLLDQLAG